jgi:23S rRNA pseudouridine2457 synthase
LLVLFNKPWGVLSQFSDPQGRPTLADYLEIPAIYPAGRLDLESEGLILLTDDGRLQSRISNPVHGTVKEYLVQVEGIPSPGQLVQLLSGVKLKDGLAKAVEATVLSRKPGWLWSRKPPIRKRKNSPVSWIRISLSEGRNRQVRRMTASVGLPTLRLIRVKVGDWSLDGLEPGKWIRVDG